MQCADYAVCRVQSAHYAVYGLQGVQCPARRVQCAQCASVECQVRCVQYVTFAVALCALCSVQYAQYMCAEQLTCRAADFFQRVSGKYAMDRAPLWGSNHPNSEEDLQCYRCAAILSCIVTISQEEQFSCLLIAFVTSFICADEMYSAIHPEALLLDTLLSVRLFYPPHFFTNALSKQGSVLTPSSSEVLFFFCMGVSAFE